VKLTLTVNGARRTVRGLGGAETLLTLLRERLGLLGTKNGCEQGECGSCSVYLDGVLVCSCLVLAGQSAGTEVVTVEGLTAGSSGESGHGESPGGALVNQANAAAGRLHPVQQAFIDAGAVQCGFCTPGLVLAVADLLARRRAPSEEEAREALAGNLCRCTGYQKVLDAVRVASNAGAP
jgi:aerobic carbon-monoxide dehydrogenase small subunit